MSFIALFLMLIVVAGGVLGIVLIVMSRAGGRGAGYPACGSCGYDVTGTLKTNVDRCPECGSSLAEVGVRPPGPQPGRKPMLITGIALIAIMLTCVGGVVFSLFAVSTTRTVAPTPTITAAPAQPAGAGAASSDVADPETTADPDAAAANDDE